MNILDIAIAKKLAGGGGGSGTDNYNDLSNLPKINDTTLSGNKSSSALGLQSEINSDSKLASDLVDDTNQDNKFVTSTEKNTWNAKQNAIDSDHKLSSSLVSFSEAEAAALDSGVDSSKVGQISTNQTNILSTKDDVAYVLGKTGKNLINIADVTTTEEGFVIDVTYINPLPAGSYVFSYTSNQEESGDVQFKARIGITELAAPVITSKSGKNIMPFTISSTADNISLYSLRAGTYSDFMICTEEDWNVSPDHQPYRGLPNYDLTRLEAEDRAALVECVDKGAKNILDGNWESTDIFTVNADKSVTINGTTGEVAATLELLGNGSGGYVSNDYGGYVLSGCSDGSMSSYSLCVFYSPNGSTWGAEQHQTTADTPIIIRNDYAYIRIVVLVRKNQTITNKTVYPMLCKKPLYDVSQTYTPPGTLPNTDLTRMMTPFFTVPINHNMIYRGQNLGDTLTADQDTALSSGNFTDLYLGDYWTKSVTIPDFYELTTAQPSDWTTNYTSYYTKSGDTYTAITGSSAPTWATDTYYQKSVPTQTVTLKAVIADFDTFYAGYASTYAGINTHHAAVIVTGFNNVVWNKTNTTAGGYVASLIHKWLVGSALPQIETWFGSAKVLSHQKLLTNAITGDAASEWAWSSQKISLLSENQIYGSKVWGNSKAANGGYEPGEAFKHLNVFNHIDANLLFGNKNIWLRDIASAVWAAYLSSSGNASNTGASGTWFAPAALILLS